MEETQHVVSGENGFEDRKLHMFQIGHMVDIGYTPRDVLDRNRSI